MEDSLAGLARVLRQLLRREARQRRGSRLTYREISAKTGWSRAVIGEYFSGTVLPPTDRFDLLINLLGATPAEQGQLATARDRIEERRRGVPVEESALPAECRAIAVRELLSSLSGRPEPAPAGPPGLEPPAALASRCRGLSDPAARLFRDLSLHPGPDLTTNAIASMAGVTPHQVEPALGELTGVQLVTASRPAHFRLPASAHLYATTLLGPIAPGPEQRLVQQRMFDHYVRTAQTAVHLIEAGAHPPAHVSHITVEVLRTRQEAFAWFIDEYRALLAVMRHAARHGHPSYAWSLASALATFLSAG